MQVACENYPGGKCTKDLQDNVNAGANYLKGQLQDNGNNAILAIGSYNGVRPPKPSKDEAEKMKLTNEIVVQRHDRKLPLLRKRKREWSSSELGLSTADSKRMVYGNGCVWGSELDWNIQVFWDLW